MVRPEGVIRPFKDGPGIFDAAFKFEAGESKTVDVEFDFSDAEKARDWSVVAWGTKAPVRVYHIKGLITDRLPSAPEVL